MASKVRVYPLLVRFATGLFAAFLLISGIFLSQEPVAAQTTPQSGPVPGTVIPAPYAKNTIKIMPLGDSITAGIGSSTGGGYRVSLWQDLKSAHWHVQFVGSQKDGPASLSDRDHEGHPGWRIDQISSNVEKWLRTYKPQVVLLHIGTNDIIQNYALSSAPSRLRSLILKIHSTLPKTIIIVAEIIPFSDSARNAQAITYNRTIPTLTKKLVAQGLPIHYVDMYHAVPVSDLVDGVHPNDSGYDAMAHVWYQSLQKVVK